MPFGVYHQWDAEGKTARGLGGRGRRWIYLSPDQVMSHASPPGEGKTRSFYYSRNENLCHTMENAKTVVHPAPSEEKVVSRGEDEWHEVKPQRRPRVRKELPKPISFDEAFVPQKRKARPKVEGLPNGEVLRNSAQYFPLSGRKGGI